MCVCGCSRNETEEWKSWIVFHYFEASFSVLDAGVNSSVDVVASLEAGFFRMETSSP